MKKRILSILTTVFFTSFLSAYASASLIQFEGSAPAGGEVPYLDPYTESGFDFEANNGNFRIVSESYDGSGLTSPTGDYGFIQHDATSITISATSAFSIQSFDSALLFGSSAGTLDITGNLAGGGTVNQSFAIDSVTSYGGSLATFTFDSLWSNLDSLVIARSAGNYLAVDNFLFNEPASSVPVPATLMLFFIGLFTLMFSNRKANKNA